MDFTQILIVDVNPDVIEAARSVGFNAMNTDILNAQGTLVSPANSFGFMDGGIDAVYTRAYPDVQAEVQHRIAVEHGGELLVGQAIVVNGYTSMHPGFIIAPTMRTPATDLRGTINPYLAMRGIMKLIVGGPVLCPGLGTASGGMDPHVALFQMMAAVKDHIIPRTWTSWTEAKEYEARLSVGLP
jgi:O-acetyl-ADP-ribose deacetylase (regulator of RNase III)